MDYIAKEPRTDYNIEEVAKRIKELREICGFSQEEMAEATGIALEKYQKYESGEKDFPFGFIYHCAEKLEVDMVELLTGENPHLSGYTVIRQGRGLPIRRDDGFDYFHLAARFKDKLAEPFLVKATYCEAEQSRPIELSAHEGQEFDFVLQGRLRFTYEGHIEELEPGDCVYYNSGKPHGMIATGGEDCTFLAMVIKDN
ncbi:helix-turn-helix domain-containing protein [Clostridiaceae bacterium OttesenSCG-928-D20]|nr:helix-turn-helix domain-containing protein [Clostridiaceae bacterium OttesenSCG-928-D20]